MTTLYIANKNYSSWSLRPWVLMKTLGIPFEEKLVPFGGRGNPEAFKSFSPTGKVPCLVEGGTAVWDSLGIVQHLAERHPEVWPHEPLARTWARCAAAEMHSGFATLRDICTMNCGIRVRVEPCPASLVRELARLDALWGEGFDRFGGPFLAGEAFTAADAFYAPVAFRIQTYDPPVAPRSREYARRLLALPAMRDWYEAALRETWRDPEHEDEARRAGVWIQDLRAAP